MVKINPVYPIMVDLIRIVLMVQDPQIQFYKNILMMLLSVHEYSKFPMGLRYSHFKPEF